MYLMDDFAVRTHNDGFLAGFYLASATLGVKHFYDTLSLFSLTQCCAHHDDSGSR